MSARPDLLTIGDGFRDAGYRTVAISASPVVRHTPSRFNPDGGFGRGFDRFLEECTYEPAACVNRQALETIDTAQGPLFLYLHYFDPHDPYRPPSDHEPHFSDRASSAPAPDWVIKGNPNPLSLARDGAGPDVDYRPEDLQHLVNLYDEEILYLDGQLENLFDELDERGLLQDAVFAIASDHGEQFLEHGVMKHCKSVYEEETRVPLIFRVPGMEPRRVQRAVQNLDIAPTLLDAAGVSWRGHGFVGQSLMPLIAGGDLPGGEAYSAQGAQRALSTERFKLIVDLETGNRALYDLLADPGERRDVSMRETKQLEEMEVGFKQMLAVAELAVGDPLQVSELLRLAEDRLRALGYLQ